MSLTRYESSKPPETSQLSLLCYGLYKRGKSRFGLSAPPPITIANLDRDIRALIGEVCPDKEVYYDNIWPVSGKATGQSEVNDMIRRVEFAAREALKHGTGTFILDGVHRLYNLLQIKLLGADYSQGKPDGDSSQLGFAKIYSYFDELFLPFQSSNVNLILTAPARKQYQRVTRASGKTGADATGNYEPRIPDVLGYILHAQIYFFTRPGRPIKFHGRLDWSAYNNQMLSGMEFDDPDWDTVTAFMTTEITEPMQPMEESINLGEALAGKGDDD